MAATVTYKGNTLTTVNNTTRTLKTAGKYMEDDVTIQDVSSSGPVLQSKTVSPSTAQQTITPDNGYDGLSSVIVNSMPSGTAGTPTATKGTVSNHALSVTPSVTNLTGYIQGSTKTGTPVTVSASELVSGNLAITENGSNIDVGNYATVSVSVEGGSTDVKLATATKTLSTASNSIQFTGLLGEPTSFAVVSASNLATGASPYKVAAVVFDGTNVIGQYITNTNNAQMTYSDSAFSKSYANGTLTITGTGANFQANEYKLTYTYGGNSANIGTAQVQVGSGVTSITFTGLEDEPLYWSCLFTSNIGTSSGYTRAHVVVNDGSDIYGMEMGSGSTASTNWTATYNNGSLTISSQSTSVGGYFHQPGYYQLTYVIGGEIEITTEELNVTANGTYTAPRGKAYTPVVVNVSGGSSGKAVQINSSAGSVHATTYTSTGISITVAKAGTYKVSWMAWKSSSSGTMGTNLYKNGNAGTNQTTWTNNYGQHITLNNQTYAAGDVLTLYAIASSTSRYCWAGNLIIEEQ